MAKKHIGTLERLVSLLRKHDLLTESAQQAVTSLRQQLELLPEDRQHPVSLSPPTELKEHPQGLALFTDGACRGNPGPGAWAAVAQIQDGTKVFESVGHEPLTTNNKMEIQAVIGAFRQYEQNLMDQPFQQYDPIMLFTDSKYVVDGLNQWVTGWKERGWKKADGKTPENLALWQELDELKQRHPKVRIGWVKGHSGHPQNEYCDQLANRLLDEEGH